MSLDGMNIKRQIWNKNCGGHFGIFDVFIAQGNTGMNGSFWVLAHAQILQIIFLKNKYDEAEKAAAAAGIRNCRRLQMAMATWRKHDAAIATTTAAA